MRVRRVRVFWACLGTLGLALGACGPAVMAVTPTPVPSMPATQSPAGMTMPTATAQPSLAATRAPGQAETLAATGSATQLTVGGTPTPDARLSPHDWPSWPVVPVVSAQAKEIYRRGLGMGNDPHVFSTIGDCQSEPPVFLGIYETDRYSLSEEFRYLQETIAYFDGSFSHQSQAVRDGLSAPSALSPLWADQKMCQTNENPVACELRLRKPSIVFINLGTNWKPGASAERYEGYLRQIVDLVIANGSLPILSTKADNVEGDHSLNLATAQVAYDYDIPLWNFWRAADDLPNHGLDADRENVYLTPLGWDRRNFTALRVLDAVWRSVRVEAPDMPQ